MKIAFRAVLIGTFMTAGAATADTPSSDAGLSADLARIREAGLSDDWGYRRLADLCDKIGPRLSGSRQADAAVEQIAAALRAVGLTVTLQPVKVPHWVRGHPGPGHLGASAGGAQFR